MSIFRAQDLTVGYKHNTVINHCSFSLERGTITGVLGANGCGKTTMLKAICGILPHGGTCTLDGIDMKSLSAKERARLCGYIPQRSGISIDIPVLDVVLMGFHAALGLFDRPTAQMRIAAAEALSAVGLGGMENHNYQQLSEGQKQLCILARTLVCDRRMLILDEPESALDYAMRYRMLTLLRAAVDRTQGCALVALHDPILALNCCDNLLFLDNGTAAGMVSPMVDPPKETERLLCSVFGPVRLMRIPDGIEHGQWVMLRSIQEEVS